MLARAHHFLNRISTGRTLLVLFILFTSIIVAVNALDVPISIPALKRLSGGIGILDEQFFYTPDRAYEIMDAYGSAGRQLHLAISLLVDIPLPAIHALFFAVAVTVIFRRAFTPDSRLQRLNLLPLAGGVIDYAENLSILSIIIRYPERVDIIASLAGYLTLAKNISILSSLILILLGLAALAVKRRRTRATE